MMLGSGRAMRLLRHVLIAWALAGPASAGDVTVFAAASLKDAMDDVAAAWQHATGSTASVSYAGSSALARQIQAGAPADVFVSANVAWMDLLEGQGLLANDTRINLLGNALVLIATGEAPEMELSDLPSALGDERLAMALHEAVPAGIYGRAALTDLGIWDAVADRVAQTHNVRAALALVATGEAPFGVVYATDAAAEPRVSVVATFPPETHPAITYPAAITADGDGADARAFMEFLQGSEADALFRRHGFILR